jgi:rhodanese-related sulfurtransferase
MDRTKLVLLFFIFILIILIINIYGFNITGFVILNNLKENNSIEHLSKNLFVNDALYLITDYDVIIIDVRTNEEHNLKKIKNSINIDYYSIDFKERLLNLNKSKTYLIYCRSGTRSSSVINMMQELEFNNVFNLIGGINSWQDNNLPLE